MVSIDFIGDIHGHFSELCSLLEKLGYEKRGDSFRYPGDKRHVVFLGDYVDRGPQIRETVNLIRSMRDSGSATALLGNHEFNALCFWQRNGAGKSHYLKKIGDGYLREHSFNKVAMHASTVDSYKGRKSEFFEVIEFFKTLPLYLETPLFRAQHASFDTQCVKKLRKQGIQSFSDGDYDSLMARANDEFFEFEDSLFHEFDMLLKGPELDLPSDLYFHDGEGVLRKRTRLRWWINPKEATLREICLQPGVEMPPMELSADIKSRNFYEEHERPVFFGHYWLMGNPVLMRENVCCLDFSVAGCRGNGRLVAYRFDGEQKLDSNKFVWVDANKT